LAQIVEGYESIKVDCTSSPPEAALRRTDEEAAAEDDEDEEEDSSILRCDSSCGFQKRSMLA
jgi:hypothetical protein